MAAQTKLKIECADSAMVPVKELKPHPQNANTHPTSQINILARMIKDVGWRHPIIVSKRSGYIVAGHGRLLAAQQIGLKEAPVDFQDFDSEEQELKFLIGDNQIAELSEFDRDKISNALQAFVAKDEDFDVSLLGFTEADAAKHLREIVQSSHDEDEPIADDPDTDFVEDANASGKSPSEKPQTQEEKHLLPLTLTDAEFRAWKMIKKRLDKVSDKETLLTLMEMFASAE